MPATTPTTCTFPGPHDASWASALLAAAQVVRADVVVDLAGWSGLDSLTLAALVRADKAARAGQGRLALGCSPGVARLLHLCGLDDRLHVHDSRASALAAIAAAAPEDGGDPAVSPA